MKRTFTVFLLIMASWIMHALQQDPLPQALKDAVLRDSACASPDNKEDGDAKMTALENRRSGTAGERDRGIA